jgi:hypothetical protein
MLKTVYALENPLGEIIPRPDTVCSHMAMPSATAIIGARRVRSALFRRFEHQNVSRLALVSVVPAGDGNREWDQ